MARFTLQEEAQVDSFERLLRGEKRVLLCNAPRDIGGLKKLTDWQIYCLAAALGLTDAVIAVWKTTFDRLPRSMRDSLLHAELVSYGKQRYSSKEISDPTYWSEFMQKYLEKELVDDVSA